MYYALNDRVMFRSYDTFGYITDNSEYGYRFAHHDSKELGEKYVSKSGAIMLSALTRKPQPIDEIVVGLLNVFEDVKFDELKNDTELFYNNLASEGFLWRGSTADRCNAENSRIDRSGVISTSTSSTNACISPSDFLRALHIEVASECNERCVHCYIPHEDKLTMIKPNIFYHVVEEGRKLNIIHVTISGGEPLLHPEIKSFLRYCHDMDLSVNLLSNLTRLDDALFDELQKNPLLSVQTSLYSMNPKVHDKITGVNGSFEKTINAVQRIVQAGIPVQISCPVMKENKDSFLDVVKWADALDISTAVQPQIFAQYDHTGKNLVHRLSAAEIGEVVQSLLESGYGSQWLQNSSEKEKMRPQDPICPICRYMLCISAKGTVYPCVGWQTNVIDSLERSSLQDIWEKSKKISELRQICWSSFPRCITCKDKGYCTVCMMSNANESENGDPFQINTLNCEAASTIHNVVDQYKKETGGEKNDRRDTN